MTPPLDLQARNLAEQLKVQHAIHLPRDEAELLLAILYGRPTWDRLVLADTNQTLTEDIPLHSERLAQALKNSLDVNLTTEQAALVLSAPPPAKLTMKGWDARFWRLDLTTEGEALQFLNMRCAGPVRSRPPVLFEMMTLDDVFGVDPDERSLQPAAYLAALAKARPDTDDKRTLQSFRRALRSASRLLGHDDNIETADNLLLALLHIFSDRDEGPGAFDDWVQALMIEPVQMESWMLERASCVTRRSR